ncbi:2-hydroxyacyl-CoA dehydratase family protein [Syntrophomonas palmitatica]|uniref:2-hydroxyacyl-CoA dehydratase family protein n=1 Tax=Syntrophomonas palmitatica TaxID=402877 RepID=UPI0006D0A553|nr:2-hydroxyacyl-CoA dehydratase family protein [Syntrophomonas palmitatica]
MNRIGFTTSIPVEIILAAGKIPVDLNNIFIEHPQAQQLITQAEEAGYPRNTCGWVKGLYAVAATHDFESLIAVMQGDCSNTQALMETLVLKGYKIMPFAYPFDRERKALEEQFNKLMAFFNVNQDELLAVWRNLKHVRQLCRELDLMTWRDNLISGWENHRCLVSSSDFNGDPAEYADKLETFLNEARTRKPFKDQVRLAYIGVPPIFTDFYEVVESMGARVVFNEIQRQFSMPYEAADPVEQYLLYTYPYGAFARLPDITHELALRDVDGVIHYTQTFCFRQIEDIIYRDKIKLPLLTLEGDKPGKLDSRSRMRLESFISMLKT